MAFDDCFMTRCPPITETFSFRRLPCRFEQSSQPIPTGEQGWTGRLCPYRACCIDSAGALRLLEDVYSPWIKVTLAEASSSIVIRSEHQYHRKERYRLSLRKHFYELSSTDPALLARDRWAPFILTEETLKVIKEECGQRMEAKGHSHDVDVSSVIENLLRLLDASPNGRKELRRETKEEFIKIVGPVVSRIRWKCQSCQDMIADLISLHASSALMCHEFQPTDQFWRYLGFVEVRQNSIRSPLASGLLVPPRRFRQDPNTFIITGDYGPLFGAPGFDCTVYSMHDPYTGGARCAQACVIMSLAFLADRGARIRGSYTLTYLALRSRIDWPISPLPNCLAALPPRTLPVRSFKVDGLTLSETEKLLTNECGVSASKFDEPYDPLSHRKAIRLIEAYVCARYPVIMYVGSQPWWWWRPQPASEPAGSKQSEDHAVVIVGIRRHSGDAEPYALITHDPGYIPFYELPVKRCIEAMCDFGREHPQNHLKLVFAADMRVQCHASKCIKAMIDSGVDSEFTAYIDTLAHDLDYRVILIHRNDLALTLSDLTYLPWLQEVDDEEHRTYTRTLASQTSQLPQSWYWCIVGFENKTAQQVWLFDAGSPLPEGSSPYAAKILLKRRKPTFKPGSVSQAVEPAPNDPPVTSCAPLATQGEAQSKRPHLWRSVMTSSSCRDLPEFFREVSTVTGVKRFDLMVLRDTDIVSIGAYLGKLGISPPWHPVGLCSMTEILTDLPYFSYIQKWIVEQCRTSGVEISALATYFSHVTSLDSAARDSAVKALINTVRLALALDDAGIMRPPVIEIVCGTILDPCKCDDCKRDARVFESTRPAKLSLLLDSLLAVVRAVPGNQVYADRAFAIGLELEPGDTYVLNGIQAMGDIVSMIDADPRYAALRGHVGFNMDVTHMRAADVPAHALEPFQDRFVHAHICDQPPGMHTRDQAIGTWSCVDRHVIDPGDRGYYPYLQILARRLDAVAAGRNPYNLPFTGTIALELEGCNRIDWIRRSLATLKHMIEATQNYL